MTNESLPLITGGTGAMAFLQTPDDQGTLRLQPGDGFIVMCANLKPFAIALGGTQTTKAQIADVSGSDIENIIGRLPVLILTAPITSFKKFEDIPVACVNALLSKFEDECQDSIDDFTGFEYHYRSADGGPTTFKMSGSKKAPRNDH